MRAFMERIQRPFLLFLMHDEITERMMMARTDESWDGLPVALDFERMFLLSEY